MRSPALDAVCGRLPPPVNPTLAIAFGLLTFAALPSQGQTVRSTASVSVTETYTTNANSSPDGGVGDWVTSLAGSYAVHVQGARTKLDGTIAASWQVYASESQNNAIAPNISLAGNYEAIDNFLFFDATANVSTSFLSPFGPQPQNIINATQNRYLSQTYSVSPYIRGVLGSTNISYLVRDDNIWAVGSNYGDGSTSPPNTYFNNLSALLTSGTNPLGWSLEYVHTYYDSGVAESNYNLDLVRLIVPWQIDPQFQVSARLGYEKTQFPLTGTEDVIYGAGLQWNPTDRTSIGGFWEERFFGSSFAWNLSHRLPNAAITANFSRLLSSYPQLALAIPAGTSVSQFLNAAFTTRIPDPAERAIAIEQFLARTGLPPTLAAPVNFYGFSFTVQNLQSVSLVLVGVRQSVTFTVFRSKSTAIAGTGEDLPPALQFGQDNTQTGAGVGYSYQLSAFTNLTANLTYSDAKANDPAQSGFQSKNYNASASMNTKLGARTTGSAGVGYSLFKPEGGFDTRDTSTFNAFVGVTYAFQ